jgi:peptidoglycan/LPS O-acetylase OafA/YrhL
VEIIKPTKQHFEVLDGLRGTAAVMVVLFHYSEFMYPSFDVSPFGHTYLAVDFFFLLSGFVIGYAYDNRWTSMSVKEFLYTRLIRLHPLVLIAMLLGIISYIFDPFAQAEQQTSIGHLITTAALSMLLIPSKSLPNRHVEIFSLNGPAWSLFMEYIANIAYAVVGRKMSIKQLKIFVALTGFLIVIVGVQTNRVEGGWGWPNLDIGFIRTAFSFFAGLLLFRLNIRIKIPWAFTLLSIVLIALFLSPTVTYNGWYESAAVIILFPLVVAAGAGSSISGFAKKICQFSGKISYPLYILHYPFIYVFGHWFLSKQPTINEAYKVVTVVTILLIGFSWLVLKFYDEPLRKWLLARLKNKQQKAVVKTVKG